MKTIFIDMDGVLCDFEKKYEELFKVPTREVRNNKDDKLYKKNWNEFLDQQGFKYLDWFEGGKELYRFLESLEIQLCILSSAGGFHRQKLVMHQKLDWLAHNGIFCPAVIVPGRKYKAGFASKDSFIIDDTADVVESFIQNGGSGVVHKNVDDTITTVKSWMIGSSLPLYK